MLRSDGRYEDSAAKGRGSRTPFKGAFSICLGTLPVLVLLAMFLIRQVRGIRCMLLHGAQVRPQLGMADDFLEALHANSLSYLLKNFLVQGDVAPATATLLQKHTAG